MHRLELQWIYLWVWDETWILYEKRGPKNEAKLFKKTLEKLNIKKFWFSLEGNLILSQVNHLKDLLYHILYLALKLKS